MGKSTPPAFHVLIGDGLEVGCLGLEPLAARHPLSDLAIPMVRAPESPYTHAHSQKCEGKTGHEKPASPQIIHGLHDLYRCLNASPFLAPLARQLNRQP